MKKKSTEVAINKSSGAEKVESIEKEVQEEGGEKTVKKTVKTADKKKQEQQAADKRVEKAKQEEKKKSARQERIEKRAEARKKRLAERKAAIEKRKAEKKARAEKHAAERKALAEKRAAAKESKIRERAHTKANRHNAHSKRKAKRENQQKGYGGWIAAVVSLGVVSLALATTVTVGAVEMRKGKETLMGAYKSTMYELTGIMENVDGDLDRIRVSDSAVQQSRILTDLLVQARLAEVDMEKLPLSMEVNRQLTLFVNRTAAECERMLAKLRNGEKLDERDRAILEKLYQTNHTVREEVSGLIENMTDKDLMDYVKNGGGKLKAAFDSIMGGTLEENKDKIMDKVEEGKDKVEEKLQEGKEKIKDGMNKMKGAGMRSMPSAPVDGKQAMLEASKAEALCAEYFSDYKIAEFQCIGETVTRGYEAYNVQGYDDKGNHLFAEISQKDGTLLRFDYYEDCTAETFDIRNAERIAEEFLEKLGYDDMEAVRLRANDSNTDFTFVYEDDGTVYYPDEIRVKVCRTRGVVSGFDATKYLKNHKNREEVKVNFNLAEAYDKLYKGLEVESSRLAVVNTARGERPAYEFFCSYEDENYFVYLDALSGEEISIVNAKSVR